jgi:acyl-CoA thioesterase-2
MQKPLDSLIQLLDLEDLEVNLFRGVSPDSDSQRVFGGQVLGQALIAAGRTTEGLHANSLHAYFLRPGDPSTPIVYQVDRTKDGRSFTTRRVIAIQHGHAIFHLEASFHRPEAGFSHQDAMPDVPDPESLPTWHERLEPLVVDAPEDIRRWVLQPRPIDSRHVTWVNPIDPEKLPPRMLVWIRADGKLPAEQLLQQCIVAYASDMTLLDTAALPHQIAWVDESYTVASLDHAMWFHHDFRADDWLLYAQESPAAAGGRGFSTGRLFTRAGELVVSVVQEGLFRRREG